MTNDKRGFSLIELIMVVAIIAVLAIIAIPQFSSYRVKAYNSAAQSDLQTFRTMMESSMADKREYPNM